jgi:hypothetical protein
MKRLPKKPDIEKPETPEEVKGRRLKAKGSVKSEVRRPKSESQEIAENTNSEIENPKSEIQNNSAIGIPHSEIKEPVTTHNSPLTTMEVHHHPQLEHKPKPWKEYILEGLMIFIAVTMGYFAESVREHLSDKEKAKQSIETIITSIASDTAQLNSILASNKLSLSYLKKFIKLKGSNFLESKTKHEFYDDVLNGSYNDVYFRSNDAAFQQLQTSGTLRLINNQGVLDSLFQYQHNTSLMLRNESDHYYFSKLVWEGMSNVIDVTYASLDASSFNFQDVSGVFKAPEGKDLAFNNDKKTVDKLFNDASTLALNSNIYVGLLNQQLVYGKKLIGILKKEYHLENE